MKLKLDRLEKVRQRGSLTFARGPACAELDRDRLVFIRVSLSNFCFACAAFQGDREHARRIEHLALTKAGLAAYGEMVPLAKAFERRLAQAMGAARLAEFDRGVERLEKFMRDDDA